MTPSMHCQRELDEDLCYVGTLPDETLMRWHGERYSTSKQLLTLYSLAHGLAAKRIVEVGFGRSTFVLARAAHENSGVLESCDVEDYSALLSPTERSVVRLHHGTSESFWPLVEAGVDFAFLDHFSSEDQPPAWIVGELEQCIAKLAPHGMVAIHDGFVARYRLREVLAALRRSVGLDFEVVTLPFNYGLTLLRRSLPVETIGHRFPKKVEPTQVEDSVTLQPLRPRSLAISAPIDAARVLMIADVPNWVFERHCAELTSRLGGRFSLTTAFAGQGFDEDDFDLIYALEWNLVDTKRIRDRSKYVTGVRSYTSWQDHAPAAFGAFLSEQFAAVHAVSASLVEALRRFVPSIALLRHGVDVDRFNPTTRCDQSAERAVVGWCGNRLAGVKGDGWIDALALLPDIELRRCEYKNGQRHQDDMPAFYDALDIYVCASLSEGHNNAVLEAAAMGRAIVTTDSGTVREWLRDGHSALIVPADIDAIVAAVEHLRDQPRLRRMLGAQARRAVCATFAWADMAEEHARFFEAALQRRSGACEAHGAPRNNSSYCLQTANGSMSQ